ncbi:MAG: isocitrate lyase/phosphoenolpyruvate mutase family protein [Proteobacteria bacterium]|nr:isocitrate lyase/phosphoenolpyruvate mutase family protein [Pseudomonadota bacterium]MBU2227584.1 isocitrate lyase/phosphoenolpyruvate mutase family protein [Pseudomonadota bacterium]MBU2261137.1 isocitrate lyase/phosphoenolpyruvate mutase family protein [Pseudomonadota bacterium]
MDKRQKLAELVERPGVVVVPGTYDALTARIAERAGFEALFATGAGISNAHLGLGDVGLLTVDELLRTIKPMCEGTNIPLIVDADTGFGGYLNVQRTVRELEHAGVAAITLEDQMFPKRCGHFRGKRMVAVGEMIGRLSAAVDARKDPRFLIIARTDARASEGLEASIERVHRYFAAGADIGFVEAPQTVEEVRSVADAFKGKPMLLNLVEGGKTPLFSAAELDQMGFKIMLCANTALRAAIKAVGQAMAALKEDGAQTRVQGMICTWQERQSIVESESLMDREIHYDQIAMGEDLNK